MIINGRGLKAYPDSEQETRSGLKCLKAGRPEFTQDTAVRTSGSSAGRRSGQPFFPDKLHLIQRADGYGYLLKGGGAASPAFRPGFRRRKFG
ncbi:MAG: hypothetical protein LBP22_02970 [Deltaproteobacteria bacterium]|nr:hypothetical protein [Deltaproteobacteria bacterium]